GFSSLLHLVCSHISNQSTVASHALDTFSAEDGTGVFEHGIEARLHANLVFPDRIRDGLLQFVSSNAALPQPIHFVLKRFSNLGFIFWRERNVRIIRAAFRV